MAIPARPAHGRKPIRRGPGKQILESKSFLLADEVRYISAGQPITIAALSRSVSWSPRKPAMPGCSSPPTGSGKVGSRRRARTDPHRGNRHHVRIGWKGRYRIDGPTFVYSDHDTGRVATIIGYPTDKLRQIA
jgi:hypothetical protein